jgi:hypothetical protein
MKAEFRLQQSQVYGNRTIIPVVSDILVCHGHGMFASVRPVALLIGEDGEWGIALLEGDSINALMEKLVLPV